MQSLLSLTFPEPRLVHQLLLSASATSHTGPLECFGGGMVVILCPHAIAIEPFCWSKSTEVDATATLLEEDLSPAVHNDS
jgi:hypothetical protein